jgi:hypothetical protein
MSESKLTVKVLGDSKGAVSALKQVDGTMGSLAKGSGVLKGAFAAVGIAGAIALGKECVDAARKAEVSQAKLGSVVDAAGGSWAKQGDEINKALRSMSDFSAFSQADLRDGLSTLVRMTGDVDASMRLMNVSMDLARATGKSTADAAGMVGKAYMGMGGILKRTLGINLEGKRGWEAIEMLQERVAGSAARYGETAQAAADRAANAIMRLKVAFGKDFVPAAKDADEATAAVANTFADNDWLRRSVEGVVGLAGAVQLLKWGITTTSTVAPVLKGAFDTVALSAMYAGEGIAAVATSATALATGIALVPFAIGAAAVYFDRERLAADNDAEAVRRADRAHSGLLGNIHRQVEFAPQHEAAIARTTTLQNVQAQACHGLESAQRSQTGAVSAAATAMGNAAIRALELANQIARTGSASRDASRKVLDYQDSLQRVKDAKAKVNELEKAGKRNTDEYRQAVRDAQRAVLDSQDAYEAITGDLARMADAYKGVESAAYKAARAIGYSSEQASQFSVPPSMRHASGTITHGREFAEIGEDGQEIVANVENPRYHDKSVALVSYAMRKLGMVGAGASAGTTIVYAPTFPVASRDDAGFIRQLTDASLAAFAQVVQAPVVQPS